MEHKFPHPIKSDKDLKYYEGYLNKSKQEHPAVINKGYEITIENKPPEIMNMKQYLRTMIGKTVRVESLIGECLQSRCGKLLCVGEDYIVLKLYQNLTTLICEASSIKYITVVHDNDLNKIYYL